MKSKKAPCWTAENGETTQKSQSVSRIHESRQKHQKSAIFDFEIQLTRMVEIADLQREKSETFDFSTFKSVEKLLF